MTQHNRRVHQLEEELERSEERLLLATQKLDMAATAVDDSDRMRKVLESRAVQDEERMTNLEEELKEVRSQAEDADKKYDEVAKKLAQVIFTAHSHLHLASPSVRSLAQVEADLERAEERAEVGETKTMELEEEFWVVANNLRSLEAGDSPVSLVPQVSEEKANQREVSYKQQIKALTYKLNQVRP